jgi:hypothetical protein
MRDKKMRKAVLGEICILTLLVTFVLTAASLTNAAGRDQVLVAPSIIGLDPTSQEWLAALPKYDVPTAPQPAILLDSIGPAPPQAEQFAGKSPDAVVAPSEAAPITPSSGFGGALVVYGWFSTVLSDDSYTGSNTGLMGIVWGQYEIRRCTTNALLGKGLTGPYGTSAGYFSKTIANPGSSGFYVEIIPLSTAGSVRTSTGNDHSYATFTTCFYASSESTTYNIGSWTIGGGDVYLGAWMIYESIVNDARNWGTWNLFANRLTPGKVLPSVTVRFPDGTWSYYALGGDIHIPTMNDARSPDVVQHEYGHFAMYKTYNNWPPAPYCPSPHYINGAHNVNCAWTEGWASFVPYMAHGDKTYTYANNFEVDEESITWGTSGWAQGPACEGRVTATLIDLSDYENEVSSYAGGNIGDMTSGLTNNLWKTFKSGMKNNLHDFMAKYKLLYGYKTPIVLTLWWNTVVYNDL